MKRSSAKSELRFLKTGVFMKKRFIAIGLVVLIAVSLIAVAILYDKSHSQPETPDFSNSQLGVTVDGWLKVLEIDEYYGNLAVVAENVSDEDVEYAVLTVKTQNSTLSFNVSALLSGTKAVLLCNESVPGDPDEVYTAWQTKDKAVFKNSPVMNEDKFDISVADGSISIKNISGEDISNNIYIYYKDKKDDLVNGSVTYRTYISGLKADSQTFIKAPEINKDNCQIIFTDYDNKEV